MFREHVKENNKSALRFYKRDDHVHALKRAYVSADRNDAPSRSSAIT